MSWIEIIKAALDVLSVAANAASVVVPPKTEAHHVLTVASNVLDVLAALEAKL